MIYGSLVEDLMLHFMCIVVDAVNGRPITDAVMMTALMHVLV